MTRSFFSHPVLAALLALPATFLFPATFLGCGGGDGDGDTPFVDAGPRDGAAQDGGRAMDASIPDGGAPPPDAPPPDASSRSDGGDETDAGHDADVPAEDAGPVANCTTRITYGSAWIHPGGHPQDFDVVDELVTWDGTCIDDGSNSYAVLSNGWQPRFVGHSACIIAFDRTACDDAPTQCRTRITYGPRWLAPEGRTTRADVVSGKVTWNGECRSAGTNSAGNLSNGWVPHFEGADGCAMSFSHEQCGGLYTNPVIPSGCADPGVLEVDDTYYVVCTGGSGGAAFRLRTSTDLVHFEQRGHIFPAGQRPTWAINSFWAPELHQVGDRYIAYFTARHSDGQLSIGAATASDPLGPYTDLGAPLVHDAGMGMIDANVFRDGDGRAYLVWKADGNAVGQPTPIYGQALAADGVTLQGSRQTLITNDLGWEGRVVEGPWIIRRDGYYYMFYSGNAYYNATYAVGVARASSPLGPYVKRGDPILATNERWIGPGHCSVVDGPDGTTQMVYHAWSAGEVGSGHQRLTLVDPVYWVDGWPLMRAAPSMRSAPAP